MPIHTSLFSEAFSGDSSVSAPLTSRASWILPAIGPLDLAMDSNTQPIFIASHNRKLAGLDLKSGRKFLEVEISSGTDQMSFDTDFKTIYCASMRSISVIKKTDDGLEPLGKLAAPPGAHTLSIDSQRQKMSISYIDQTHSKLQRFIP